MAVSAIKDGAGFRNTYGLVFDTTSPNSFIIFRDANSNNFYDSGEQFGKQGVIDGRFEIDALRYTGTGSDVGAKTSATVLFQRPNFDARFFKAISTPVSSSVYGLEIDLRLKGTTGTGPREVRTIEITRAGQISVKDI
jgi:hypothetical protein